MEGQYRETLLTRLRKLAKLSTTKKRKLKRDLQYFNKEELMGLIFYIEALQKEDMINKYTIDKLEKELERYKNEDSK